MYGDGMQVRDWLHVERPRRGHRLRAAPRRARRGLQRGRRHASCRTARSSGGCSPQPGETGASCARCRTGRATTAATRWTAPGWPRWAGGRAVTFDEGLPATVAWYRDQPGLGRERPERRLGRLLRAPVRRPPGPRAGRGRRGPCALATAVARLTDAGRRRRRSTGVSGARWSRPSRTRRSPARGADRAGTARRSTSTRSRRPRSAALLDRDRPEVVIHTAAWTDVDGCARSPTSPCAATGPPSGSSRRPAPRAAIDLVFISTNEVFDGTRTDGRATRPTTSGTPINPYGAAQGRGRAAGDRRVRARRGARAASASSGPRGCTARPATTSRPRSRPRRCGRSAAGEPLRVVADEIGVPTYTPDLAEAIVELLAEDAIAAAPARTAIHHLVNGGRASRADWAREVLRATRHRRRGRGRPGLHLAARLHPAGVGRPGAHAAPVGRADARLARGVRPRRAGPGPVASTGPDPAPARGDRPSPAAPPVPPAGRVERATPPLTIPRLRATARAATLEGIHPRPGVMRPAPAPAEPRSIAQASVVALVAVLLAGLGAVAPPPRPSRTPRPAPRSRSSWARPTGPHRELPLERGRGLRRGDQVHVQRRPGLQPQRHRVEGQGRGRRRLDHRVPGPRQRLAEPVHLRPQLHDQGRLRAQLRRQRRRQADRLREQVLRRALDPRPDARRPNAVVLLFHLCYASGNPESGRRAVAVQGQAARRQLRRRVPPAGARAVIANGHSHDPLLHPRAVHDPPDDRPVLAQRARLPRQRLEPTPSVRNPGYTFQMDPERTGYYYRSIAGKMSLRTQDVTGAAVRGHIGRSRRRWSSRATPAPPSTAPRSTAPSRTRAAGIDAGRHARHASAKVRVDATRDGRRPWSTAPRSTASTRPRARGLDDRHLAHPARQRGAARLGGRRRHRRLLAERRRLAGRAWTSPSGCPSPPRGPCGSSMATAESRTALRGLVGHRADHAGPRPPAASRTAPTAGSSGPPTAGATARSRPTAASASTPRAPTCP